MIPGHEAQRRIAYIKRLRSSHNHSDLEAGKGKRKPIVAVDLDEVLGYFVRALASFHNETYGTELTEDDFDRCCLSSFKLLVLWISAWRLEPARRRCPAHHCCSFMDSYHFKDVWGGSHDESVAKVI